jgi:nucleotide-binding universal stress UspA family protein
LFTNVVVGLKEGLDHGRIVELTKSAAPVPAKIHLMTMLRVGTTEDELSRLRRARNALDEKAERLRSDGYDATCEASLMVAAAATDLLREAASRQADLIVIGLAKRSRVGKALLGSDAQRVLLGAGCPVLVTHLQ